MTNNTVFTALPVPVNRALEQEPTARLWSLYGDLNFMEENYEDAYEAYRKSAGMDPDGGRAFLMMAYCAMELGNKDDAKSQLAEEVDGLIEAAGSFGERVSNLIDNGVMVDNKRVRHYCTEKLGNMLDAWLQYRTKLQGAIPRGHRISDLFGYSCNSRRMTGNFETPHGSESL